MEEKKETRGGDRRSGTGVKTARMFGYKYTPEEYDEMTRALEELKAKTGKTTSAILYELLTSKLRRELND